MAFIKNVVSGHTILFGQGTLAEVDAVVAAMSVVQRAQATGFTFEVVGDTIANNGLWELSATSRFKISNDIEAGTMSSYDIKVGAQTATIADGGVATFAGAGLITASLDAATKTVSYKIASTVADEGRVVKIDGSGVAILAAENFVDKLDTNTVGLTLTNGILEANAVTDATKGMTTTALGVAAKLSQDARQALSFSADGGLFVKGMAISADSVSRLSYDAATNTLGITALGMTTVRVDSVSTTVAQAFAAVDTQEGDVTIVTNLGQVFIDNGNGNGDATDWTIIETPAITDSAIRALFSAEKGVQYNAAIGRFSSRLRAVDSTHANELKLDGDDLYVDVFASSTVINSKTYVLSSWLTALDKYTNLAYYRTYNNALTETTDANEQQTVQLGGPLVVDTTIQAGNFDLNLASNGTGMIRVTTDQFEIQHGQWMTNQAGVKVFMALSSFNTWYHDTSAVYPN